MSRTRKRFLIATVAAVLTAVGLTTAAFGSGTGVSRGGVPAASPAAARSSIAISNCKIPKADFITNDITGLGTTSTSYVAVPGMTKTISIPGTTRTCVIVKVSAYAFATSGHIVFVAVTLDSVLGNPVETQFAADDVTFAREHAAIFAFAGVSPGTHTVSMVFRSFDGAQVFLHRPAMEIDHK